MKVTCGCFFSYSTEKDNSVCTVKDKNGKECGKELSGKNTSNLETHLARFHDSEFKRVNEEEERQKKGKGKTATEVCSKTGDASSQRNLHDCLGDSDT